MFTIQTITGAHCVFSRFRSHLLSFPFLLQRLNSAFSCGFFKAFTNMSGWKVSTDNINSFQIRPLFRICIRNMFLKAQFNPNSKIPFFRLTCNDIYPSGLFWCKMQSLGDICLLLNIMEKDYTWLVVLKTPKLNDNVSLHKS